MLVDQKDPQIGIKRKNVLWFHEICLAVEHVNENDLKSVQKQITEENHTLTSSTLICTDIFFFSFFLHFPTNFLLEINNFIYVESSFPHEKGEKARFFSRVTVPTRNCFSFWYHMYGNTTGRLNVLLRSSKDNEEVLLWRLAGPFENIWNKAEIPIYHNYAYEVTTNICLACT